MFPHLIFASLWRNHSFLPFISRNGRACWSLKTILATLQRSKRSWNSFGHSVTLASSAEEAIKLAEMEALDLVVSDIGLPGMSGFALMTELRHRFALPGIALTGFDGSDDVHLYRIAGFSEHIVKPVEIAHLEAAIRRVLGVRPAQ